MSNEQIARGSVLSIIAELDKRDAEIERLRERMREAAKLNMGLMDIRRDNEAEIERLRAEIEPLRIALGLLTTIKPTMEIDVTDPVGMAQQIAVHVADEIERLRGEVAVWLECYKTEKAKREELTKRVREALGDSND